MVAKVAAFVAAIASISLASVVSANAQDTGPLLPHVGARFTTAFSNRFGPDAESILTFTAVTPEMLSIAYASTRGLVATRNILVADRQSSAIYVLGFGENMPVAIPGTTSIGISGASLVELRTTGKTALSLAYDAQLSRIPGQLTLVEKDITIPILVEGRLILVPTVHATGNFASGEKTGIGDFYFLDNKNNPLMLQSTIQFSWEKQLRAERIIGVAAGVSMRPAMEQALSTLRKYDLYGLHFNFNKATLRSESSDLIKDVAITLKNNPTWTLQINGHTDSIGDAGYNLKLSAERAASVAAALVQEGVASTRLATTGLGETQPKGNNATLEGRALNRRVELVRTDR